MSVGLSLTFGLYVLLLVAIGVYFFLRTETKHLADYMLAGRNVGTWPIAISEVASVASGWTFFAWVGVGFTTGLNGLWFSLAMLVVVLFLYRYVAPTFRQQSAGDDLRHHRVRVRRTRRHTRPPLAFLVLWPKTTGAGVLTAIGVGLASAIGNLYLWPDTFPILVWPLTLAAFLIACVLSSSEPTATAA